MTGRRKLPAYGKQLLNARRAGDHPLCVHLIFGRDWKAATRCAWAHLPGAHPLLCVHPVDYAPGMYDFRAVTAVMVALFDQDALAGECPWRGDQADFGRLYDLAGELARYAAGVDIHSLWERPRDAREIAHAWRAHAERNNPEKNHGWPRWWSEDIERDHTRRRFAWLGSLEPWIAERIGKPEPAASL